MSDDTAAARLKRAQSLVGTSEGRPENDFYPTPAWVTRALLQVHPLSGTVWEPACGDGAMSRILEEFGCDVLSTDLIDRGYPKMAETVDFLNADLAGLTVDHIVTNPPYSLALEFIERSLSIAQQSVSMFLKLQFLEGQKRWDALSMRYPADVYVFTKRPQLTRNGEKMKNGGMIAFAWYVWKAPFVGTSSRLHHIRYNGPED